MRDDAATIQLLYDNNRKIARDRYRKLYDTEIDDPSIDQELEQVLRAHDFYESGDNIAVPAKIVLALVMRKRGPKGRAGNRPALEAGPARFRPRALRDANKRWRELVAADPRRGWIKVYKKQAAEEVHRRYSYLARITVAWLLENMKLREISAGVTPN